jgi:hypothetical protein
MNWLAEEVMLSGPPNTTKTTVRRLILFWLAGFAAMGAFAWLLLNFLVSGGVIAPT